MGMRKKKEFTSVKGFPRGNNERSKNNFPILNILLIITTILKQS